MNVKKTLQNRIRGWLPKEPKVPKKPTRTGFPLKMKADARKQNSLSLRIRIVGLVVILGVYLPLLWLIWATLAGSIRVFASVGLVVASWYTVTIVLKKAAKTKTPSVHSEKEIK
jgi:hypothetical protein